MAFHSLPKEARELDELAKAVKDQETAAKYMSALKERGYKVFYSCSTLHSHFEGHRHNPSNLP
jgi:hypothetical protein